MWLVLIGVLQMLLHWLEIGPFANWNWDVSGDLWLFLWPFFLAIIWWAWADGSGHNARKEMDDLDKRKEARRMKNLEALGRAPKKRH